MLTSNTCKSERNKTLRFLRLVCFQELERRVWGETEEQCSNVPIPTPNQVQCALFRPFDQLSHRPLVPRSYRLPFCNLSHPRSKAALLSWFIPLAFFRTLSQLSLSWLSARLQLLGSTAAAWQGTAYGYFCTGCSDTVRPEKALGTKSRVEANKKQNAIFSHVKHGKVYSILFKVKSLRFPQRILFSCLFPPVIWATPFTKETIFLQQCMSRALCQPSIF